MCFSYLLGVLCFSYMFYIFCSFLCDILISRYKREITRSYIVAYMFLQANNNIASGRGLNGESGTALGPVREVGTFLVPNFVMVPELLAAKQLSRITAYLRIFLYFRFHFHADDFFTILVCVR